MADAADAQSVFEETLAAIKELLGEHDEIASKDIVERLAQIEDGPWAEWGRDRKPITQNALARLFKPHKPDIGSKDSRRKGYRRTDLEPLFEAYLKPPVLTPPSHPRTRAQHDEKRTSDDFQPRTTDSRCADGYGENPHENNAVRGCADAVGEWSQKSRRDDAGAAGNGASQTAAPAGEPQPSEQSSDAKTSSNKATDGADGRAQALEEASWTL